jgi:hypothetical protein
MSIRELQKSRPAATFALGWARRVRMRSRSVPAALTLAVILGLAAPGSLPAADTRQTSQAPATTYACPMHPDATATAPGTCPRCGMALVAMDPFDAREYIVDVSTEPRVIKAGAPFSLRLTVREPVSRAVITTFATVHEKQFHLFVISQDLQHYDHVHPEQQADGSWLLSVTLPHPGYYRLYSDFLPAGGTPQVIALPLVTSGFRGDIATSSARLVPDRNLTSIVGTMRVSLALPETPLTAGREERFAFELTDRRTGAPVTDLEPYLAAWGHTLLLSEDTQAVVHAHPLEPVLDDPAARGGPVITFKAMFPKAGRYRLWTQMKRAGTVSTAVFTISVASPVLR